MSVCCECSVLSVRGLCVRLITCSETPTECDVSECDRDASIMRRSCPSRGCHVEKKENISGCVYYWF